MSTALGRHRCESSKRRTRTAPARIERPDDVDVTPDRLHPRFHGSYDWHSSAHMQWFPGRLLTLAPDQSAIDRSTYWTSA